MEFRWLFLSVAAIVVSIAGAPVRSAQAQSTITLKISDYLPPSHGLNTQLLEPWARKLEQKTDGKVKVQIYPGNSAYGNITQQLDQVKAGVVDIALGLSGLPRGRFPATSVIEMPFLVRTADAGTRTLWDLYKEGVFGNEYKGMKVLLLFTHNAGLFHTTSTPVREIADLKGLRMRTPSVPISEMMEYLGATPVGMPPSQVYENLQKGTLDGVVFTWDAVHAFRLNEVLKYHTDIKSYVVSFYIVMNQRKYDSLPPDVRKAIDEISGDNLVPEIGPLWDRLDAIGHDEAIKRGQTIIPVSDQERAHWQQALQPMIQDRLKELQKDGVKNAPAIYERAQELVKKYEH